LGRKVVAEGSAALRGDQFLPRTTAEKSNSLLSEDLDAPWVYNYRL
jgi:3-deoxy-D-arabino-heptulosonate 7-phosphate (DAHP) synthase